MRILVPRPLSAQSQQSAIAALTAPSTTNTVDGAGASTAYSPRLLAPSADATLYHSSLHSTSFSYTTSTPTAAPRGPRVERGLVASEKVVGKGGRVWVSDRSADGAAKLQKKTSWNFPFSFLFPACHSETVDSPTLCFAQVPRRLFFSSLCLPPLSAPSPPRCCCEMLGVQKRRRSAATICDSLCDGARAMEARWAGVTVR